VFMAWCVIKHRNNFAFTFTFIEEVMEINVIEFMYIVH